MNNRRQHHASAAGGVTGAPGRALTVAELLEALPFTLDLQPLNAVGEAGGQIVRFAVVAVNVGEGGELELVLEPRSVPRIASA